MPEDDLTATLALVDLLLRFGANASSLTQVCYEIIIIMKKKEKGGGLYNYTCPLIHLLCAHSHTLTFPHPLFCYSHNAYILGRLYYLLQRRVSALHIAARKSAALCKRLLQAGCSLSAVTKVPPAVLVFIIIILLMVVI